MTWFHLRQFVKVTYFVQLMAVSTIALALAQWLAVHAWGGDPQVAWVRAGIVGMWTTSTAAAGILGFERFKGTLVHLVIARINPLWVLAAVVSAAATFGVFAFPVSWVTWVFATRSTSFSGIDTVTDAVALLGQIALLWVACLSVSFVVAALFVLTPNAIAYEELLLTPVFLASGLVFTASSAPAWLAAIGTVVPLSGPASLLLGSSPSSGTGLVVAESIMVIAVWLVAAWWLGRRCLDRARRSATLEVI